MLKLFKTIFLLLISFSSYAQTGYFIPNKGQLPDNVKFHARLKYGDFYIEKTGFKIQVRSVDDVDEKLSHNHHTIEGLDSPTDSHKKHIHTHNHIDHDRLIKGHNFDIKFIGADLSGVFSSVSAGNFKINQFQGNDKNKWVAGLTPLQSVTIRNIYPKTDLKVYFWKDGFKYEFILQPGADASNIKIQYQNLDKINFSAERLELITSVGTLSDSNPISFSGPHKENKIPTVFKKINDSTFTLIPQTIPKSEVLVIDPQLSFATFSGSTQDNWGYTATYDDKGFAYAGGVAFFGGYPTTAGAFQTNYAGGSIDISISKYTPDGRSLAYSTYIGGSGSETPHSMIVNAANELIVYGASGSSDFPTTANAYDKTFNGGSAGTLSNVLDFDNGSDIVIFKLSSTGEDLTGSTFFGGSGNDGLNNSTVGEFLNVNYADIYRGEVITDGSDEIFIASVTSSTDITTANNCFQPVYGGGGLDGLVAHFNADLSSLIWSSYLGGNDVDACYALKQNSKGDVYVTGGTMSSDLNANGLQNNWSGNIDGFLGRISNDGTTLLNATYIGNSAYDQSYFVEVDFEDKVYAYGQTSSALPISSGVYSNANASMFLHKYDETLSVLEKSTLFGDASFGTDIVPTALMVSDCKEIYISGWGGAINDSGGNMRNMPLTANAFQADTDGSDFYFAVFAPDFEELNYGSFFGGNGTAEHVDGGTSRFDRNGTIYQSVCAGCGGSSVFPTTAGVYSPNNQSSNCNLALIKFDVAELVANIEFLPEPNYCENTPINFINQSTGGASYKWILPSGEESTSFNTSVTFDSTGIYEITLIAYDPNSCIQSDTATTIIEIIKIEEITIDIDTFVCQGGTLEIKTKGGPDDNNYSWYTDNQNFTENGNTFTTTPDSTTQYFVQYTNKCGSSISEVTVPVYFIPTPSNNNFTVCEKETGEFAFEYNELDTIFELFNRDFELTDSTIKFTPFESSIYYIQTNSECGTAIDTFVIKYVTFDYEINNDTLVCPGDTLNLTADSKLSFEWLSPSLTPLNSGDTLRIEPQTSTIYPILFKQGNCSIYDTVIIDVLTKPEQPHESEYLVNYTESQRIDLNPFFEYNWSPREFLSCADCPSVTVTPDNDIQYFFTYIDTNNCVLVDSVTVKVSFPLYIPNTFTPNNDGTNDFFFAQSTAIGDFEISIFNRWGQQVFYTQDINEGWDGTFNGIPQQQDTYVYKIIYTRRYRDKILQRVGRVNLIR